jgi:hypothetical protein
MRKRLKINTLNNKWHDQDQIMLHAAFQCLADYIEKEKPDEVVDWWGTGPEAYAAWVEMHTLYRWWITRDHDAWWTYDDDMDDIMLKRLVEIRGYMWT